MSKSIKDLLIVLVFAILWTCKPISYQDLVRNQSIRERTVVLRGGQEDSRGKSRIGKNILLEKLFPDWPERVDFQNKQQKFFESGRKKQIAAKRVRRKIQLTPEEQDAFNYFSRTGFYKNYQSPKTSPNIFDTRESFLKKMNNREMRTNFLNSYNNRFKKNN
jgi:hypothetical protein